MKDKYNIVIVGGGPAGLSAALEASKYTDNILLVDENIKAGGQLIKQTHKFFGSKNHHASERGINIAEDLIKSIDNKKVDFLCGVSAAGFYKPHTLLLEDREGIFKVDSEKFIFATGASENIIPFVNNDLPGVYGAGAVQTLMNLYGVVPGKRVLMIGAGNIGLIVSYQLFQSGVDIAGVVEASPYIGGYSVHAAKLRRMQIPIFTNHSIKAVYGNDCVEKAVISQVDSKWKMIKGTEKEFDVDTVCLAVGLTPSTEVLSQAGCEMIYARELCGYVPTHDKYMETSVAGVFIAGDASGIEEASAAMLEGKMAGLKAAYDIEKFNRSEWINSVSHIEFELKSLRSGPHGQKAMAGKKKIEIQR
ncbi:MAG: FAD-dependent oxidoreductase [Clostridia bacterium]|nr:FAD-dependent oxidoreductase [Clostridia bacterium]